MWMSSYLAGGGQTFIHKFRMLKQVLSLAITFGVMSGLIGFVLISYSQIEFQDIICFIRYIQASCTSWFYGSDNLILTDYFTGQQFLSSKYISSPEIQQKLFFALPAAIKRNLVYSLYIGSLAFLIISVIWYYRGIKTKNSKHLSGGNIKPWRHLKKQIGRENKASKIHLGGLPLIKDSEREHILISGTTGSGKTNCFYQLLPQIRKQKQRAIIIDTTGEFVSRYYREGKDILLNPFDTRSASWNFWTECSEPYHYQQIAENLIPHELKGDPFWSNAARTVFAASLKNLGNKGEKFTTNKKLSELLLTSKLNKLAEFLKNSEAGGIIDITADKTAASIRSLLNSYLEFLPYLPDGEEPFSIRSWVQEVAEDSDQWLFLVATPEQRAALSPLLSLWCSIAIKGLLGRDNNSLQPHLWFILDELPSLQKLPDLALCLAESRKYGGCVVMGVQNAAQLENIYGPNITQTLTDLCSTKLVFRLASMATAKQLSEALGTQEIEEISEGISYGANDIRDGVNLASQRRYKPLVAAEELLALNKLAAYIKLPGNYPLTKIQFEQVSQPLIAKSFAPKNKAN